MLWKVFVTWVHRKNLGVAIQMNDAEWYFPVVLLIILRNDKSGYKILKHNHSDESYWAVLSFGAVYYAEQGGSNDWVCGRNPRVW